MKKRALSLLLVLTFLLSIFMLCSTAFAATGGEDVLSAELTTDKAEYAVGEEIRIALSVTNQSAYAVKNVRTSLVLPSGLQLTAGELTPEAFALGVGENKTIDYSAELPPTELKITGQPVSTTVNMGEKATVSVEAQGDGLTYAWYFKNRGMDKFNLTTTFTGNTYTATMDAVRSGRQVYCVITDAYGNSVTTDTVTLSVRTGALEITRQPQSVAVPEGTAAEVTFEVQGVGLTYAWYWAPAGSNDFTLTTSFKSNSYSIGVKLACHSEVDIHKSCQGIGVDALFVGQHFYSVKCTVHNAVTVYGKQFHSFVLLILQNILSAF